MNKTILFLSIGILTSLSSCERDKLSPELTKQNDSGSTHTLSTIKTTEDKAYELLKAIYTESYNGDFIDILKMEDLSINRGYTTQDQLRNLQTSQVTTEEVESLLPKGMLDVYQSMILLLKKEGTITPQQRDSLLKMAHRLLGQERIDTEAMVWGTYLTFQGLKRLETEGGGNELRASGRQAASAIGKFACNLASGGIGGVWGTMASGIAIAAGATSAVFTGGLSFVVALAVGSAISTVAC